MGNGHGAWGIGQWAGGIGHGAWGISLVIILPTSSFPTIRTSFPIPITQFPLPISQLNILLQNQF
jgi:hypothetical protein